MHAVCVREKERQRVRMSVRVEEWDSYQVAAVGLGEIICRPCHRHI